MTAILMDTNIVIRLIDRNANAHEMCRKAVEALIREGKQTYLAP